MVLDKGVNTCNQTILTKEDMPQNKGSRDNLNIASLSIFCSVITVAFTNTCNLTIEATLTDTLLYLQAQAVFGIAITCASNLATARVGMSSFTDAPVYADGSDIVVTEVHNFILVITGVSCSHCVAVTKKSSDTALGVRLCALAISQIRL
jgi:hypothetical protein